MKETTNKMTKEKKFKRWLLSAVVRTPKYRSMGFEEDAEPMPVFTTRPIRPLDELNRIREKLPF
jgi:hypothetical protein